MTAGRAPSLLARLASGTIAVSLLAALAAGLLLYLDFRTTDDRMRERTLMGPARQIEQAFKAGGVTPELLRSLAEGGVHFAVVDDASRVLAASDGITAPLYKISHRDARDYFILRAPEAAQPLYGVTRRVTAGDGRALWIQVASSDSEMQVQSLIAEFARHLAWLWAPFVLVLLVVNLLIIRHGLLPLRIASARAAAIGPETVSARLPAEGMPAEVAPLVAAVNLALSRLEDGYAVQRAFIADAAHELRTPLAVLEAHIEAMGPAAAPLLPDAAAMTRLVNQLLDVARVDTMVVAADDVADLRALAVEVGTGLAPLAVRRRRSIEVVAGERPVLVRGMPDLVSRALRNLVENALAHTPADSLVTIVVEETGALQVIDRGPGIPPEQRPLVCQRFWRGRRSGGGAGLGLAIVARTMEAHGGRVDFADAPGGGASVTLRFPVAFGQNEVGRNRPDGL